MRYIVVCMMTDCFPKESRKPFAQGICRATIRPRRAKRISLLIEAIDESEEAHPPQELMPRSPAQGRGQCERVEFGKDYIPPEPANGIRITPFPKEVWPHVRPGKSATDTNDTAHEMGNCDMDGS